jgi:hypothetical protein
VGGGRGQVIVELEMWVFAQQGIGVVVLGSFVAGSFLWWGEMGIYVVLFLL